MKIVIIIAALGLLVTGCILYGNHVDAVNAEHAKAAEQSARIERLRADVQSIQQHLKICDVEPKCSRSLKVELEKELTEKKDALAGAEYAR